MLPDFDGFEVARRLKGESHTREIPIVMLTALDREEYRQRGKTAGAVDYLTKPFDPDRLMDAIRENASRTATPPPTPADPPDRLYFRSPRRVCFSARSEVRRKQRRMLEQPCKFV